MAKLLDYNRATGEGRRFHYDRQSNRSIIEHVQDVEPILDFNRAKAPTLDRRADWWFIGTIPNGICLQWSTECGHKPYSKGWREYAAKQLNKAEYAKLNPNRVRLETRVGR